MAGAHGRSHTLHYITKSISNIFARGLATSTLNIVAARQGNYGSSCSIDFILCKCCFKSCIYMANMKNDKDDMEYRRS